MITANNYISKTENIDFSVFPEPLRKGHDLALKALSSDGQVYQGNETIKRVVDTYIEKLNEYLKTKPVKTTISVKPKEGSKSTSKSKSTVVKPAVKNNPYKGLKVEIRPASGKSKKFIVWDIQSNQAFANEKFDSIHQAESFTRQNEMILVKALVPEPKNVEMLPEELRFIRRYVAMHGKVRTRLAVMRLLTSLQKAMLEKRIRKTSPYAKEILQIQDQLIKAADKMSEAAEISINAKNLEHYKEITSSQRIRTSIALLKRFVAIHGKESVEEKAERLRTAMERMVKNGKVTKEDPYASKLNDAYKSLVKYLKEKKTSPEIRKSELNGIYGLLGISGVNNSSTKTGLSGVISSQDLMQMNFETIGLTGKFRELIGDPAIGFMAMVFGQPKSGKSTLMLNFAHHLASNHGEVLYVAFEEGYGYTLKEKISRIGAIHPRLHFAEDLPGKLSSYDFVFIDSVSRAGMDLEDMVRLRKQNPKTSFIFIFHSTKDGKFRGGNELAHEVDVIINVEPGLARASGRFNGGGEMNV